MKWGQLKQISVFMFAKETPSNAELAKAGLTPEGYKIRNQIWHKLLARIEPDERDRIREAPHGNEAISLAFAVEMALAREQKAK